MFHYILDLTEEEEMSQRKSSGAAGLAVRCWPGDSVSLTETLQSPLHSVQSQLHPALTVHLPLPSLTDMGFIGGGGGSEAADTLLDIYKHSNN